MRHQGMRTGLEWTLVGHGFVERAFIWAVVKPSIQLSRGGWSHVNHLAGKDLLPSAHCSMRACWCNVWGRALFCRSPLTREVRWYIGWRWLSDYSRKLASASVRLKP